MSKENKILIKDPKKFSSFEIQKMIKDLQEMKITLEKDKNGNLIYTYLYIIYYILI